MRSFLLGCGFLFSCLAFAQDDATPGDEGYRVLFISDLHMGVGRDPANSDKWHPTEDFRWHAAFEQFLRHMSETAEGTIEIVILGDFLELWQSINDDCDHQDKDNDLGCSEAEALARTDRVIEQHREVFSALSAAARQEDSGITIVAGNHDVALTFASVREKVLAAFDPDIRDHVNIPTSGIWISPDQRIAAEHGQQIGKDPNRFEGWPDQPFIEKNGEKYLVQPWGEHFVQELFNDVERRFPIIDNLSEEILGVKYLNKGTTWRQKLTSVAKAIRFVLTQTSWDQTKQFLGEDRIPEWRVEEIQSGLDSDAARWDFLVASIPPAEEWHGALETIEAPASIPPLTLDEIEAICDRRWALSRRKDGEAITLCDSTGKLGMIAERVNNIVNPQARDKAFREYFDSLVADKRANPGFDRYIYGHTHKVEIAYRPYVEESDEVVVYNDGAWQRTVTPEQLCTIAKENNWADDEVLEKALPEDLPACYPFIVAISDAASGKLTISNSYWIEEEDGSFEWADSCTVAPSTHPDCE